MAAEPDDLSALLDKFGEEYLNCSICHERYKQPKILTCLHSFCEVCLIQYQLSQSPVKLSCPVCRQETVILEGGVPGLKTNFPLRGMMEAFQKNERILASGRSSPSVGERIEAPAPQQRTVCDCKKHPGERTWFYCDTCQNLVCRVCTTKTHREHDFQEIDIAAISCRDSLRGYCPRLEDLLESLEGALGGLTASKSQLAASVQKNREEVMQRALAVVALVTEAKQRILDKMEAKETKRNKEINEQVKSLSVLRERVRHSLAVTEHLTTGATDEDLLSLSPLIRDDLKDLSVQTVSHSDPNASFMALLPAMQQTVVELGRLVLETEKWKMVKKVVKWGSDKGDFDGARGVAVCSDGEIAIADLGMWSRGIILFSPEWSYKASIKFTDNPRDVASANGCIFVADSTPTVKVYDSQRKLAFEFLTTDDEAAIVNIVSIATNRSKDSILVGDVKRKVLTEHRVADGRLMRTIPINVPPYFLAANQDGSVLVSGLDTGEIERVDGEGETEITVRPVIEGGDQVSCRGVCYDKEGKSFYVVVHGKESINIGHIHQFSTTGIFLGCLARDLYDPNGITLTARGELAVADCFSVKVFEKI